MARVHTWEEYYRDLKILMIALSIFGLLALVGLGSRLMGVIGTWTIPMAALGIGGALISCLWLAFGIGTRTKKPVEVQ